MTDAKLRQDVLDELEFEPRIDAAHIGVAAENGVVTVSGHVPSYSQKVAAVQAVWRVKGVRAVADEIEVRFLEDKKTSDDQIARRALDVLEWDTSLPGRAIRVTVHQGLVTLAGDVDWHYQRKAAEETIRKLSGVRAVVNNIIIKPRVEAEDVQRKIEQALERNAAVEARAIRVTVENGGKVVLEGKVSNWNERRAVEEAAWSAAGVKAVEDRLTIA